MRAPLEQELDHLQTEFEEQVRLVLRMLRAALKAVLNQDEQLADEVIQFDDTIDHRYIAILERIQALLARQTPVAADLRLVLALLHVNLHLERMADYCVTVAKLEKVSPNIQDSTVLQALEEMATRAEEMIKTAHAALDERDVAKAESLVALDELIDRANRRVLQYILAGADTPEYQEWGLYMITLSRCLERIGDHAVDIGEQTAYVVTGEFKEFTDASSDHSTLD